MPNGNLIYQRGEIRWVKLDPTLGVESQKTRACLIIQLLPSSFFLLPSSFFLLPSSF